MHFATHWEWGRGGRLSVIELGLYGVLSEYREVGRSDVMRQSTRTTLKVMLSVFLSLFSLPMLCIGGYLLFCFIRIHFSGAYYTEYPYGTAALVWIGLGASNLWAVIYGVRKRSYYGTLFVIPVFVGLAAMVIIPDVQLKVPSFSADDKFLRHVKESSRIWYESHHRFPSDATEFRSAIGTVSLDQSPYKQRGKSLPYEIVATTGADGPKLGDTSPRPGEVYYCVSGDSQEFWVTMTTLDFAVASKAVLARFLGLSDQRVLIVHTNGKDYLEEKPL